MTFVDLLILAVIGISLVSAFIKGFFVEIFSLAGVVVGLLLAAAYYGKLAGWLMRWIHTEELAKLSAFLLIDLAVMLLSGLIGRMIRGAIHQVGLGFLDRLLGAFFGLVKGFVLVTLALMAIAAFLPNTEWLQGSRLAPLFLGAAHEGSHITPFALGEKIRQGVQLLRMAEPSGWKAESGIVIGSAGLLPPAPAKLVVKPLGWNATINPAIHRGRQGEEFL